MESPKYVQTSLAAAMTLDLKPGKFHREAELGTLNLLLTYKNGCIANCAYCGLSRSRIEEKTFIRVQWQTYPLDKIINRVKTQDTPLKRVCVSMVTHRKALDDLLQVTREVKSGVDLPISALITPTLIRDKEDLIDIQKEGVDRIGISIDTATKELFENYRGAGVKGPHSWDEYWQTIKDSVEIFGTGMVGIHLIVGLGETEKEAIEVMQKASDLGAVSHLFSFYPERGTLLGGAERGSISSYRRVQLARYLIDNNISSLEKMKFNAHNQLVNFGISKTQLEQIIDAGEPFMTSGCPGQDCKVACNRPYGNERPSESLRNYPFKPNSDDILEIRKQIIEYEPQKR